MQVTIPVLFASDLLSSHQKYTHADHWCVPAAVLMRVVSLSLLVPVVLLNTLQSPTFSSLSPIAIKVLNEILVTCTTCNREVPLLIISKDCKNHTQQAKSATIDDIIHQPLEAPPTQLETRAVSKVMSRIIYHQNDSTMITLPRKGTVIYMYLIQRD